MSILAFFSCCSVSDEPTRFDVSHDKGLVKASENFASRTAAAAKEPSFSSNAFLASVQDKIYSQKLLKADRSGSALAERVVDMTISIDPKIAVALLEDTQELVAGKLKKALPSSDCAWAMGAFKNHVQDAASKKAALKIDRIILQGNFEGEFEAVFTREAEKMVSREYFDTLENAVTALKLQYAEHLDKMGEREVEKRIQAVIGGNAPSSLSPEKQKACDFLLVGITL
jgi:hypothetical protein